MSFFDEMKDAVATAATKNKRVEAYFNWGRFRFSGPVVMVFLVCLNAVHVLLFLLVEAALGEFLYSIYKRKMSDREMDSMYDEMLKTVLAESSEALDLAAVTQMQTSNVIWSPSLPWVRDGITLNHEAFLHKGTARFSALQYVVLHYGEDQLLIYRVGKDFLRGISSTASTAEYFYDDIVAIDSSNNLLVLTTRGGTKIEAPFASKEMAEAAITNVRSMLRIKKQSARLQQA